MARPLIALLTDFGLADHYVGVMKGVVLGICPEAQLVDLSHDVPPQDIVAGMVTLDLAYRDFPAGTVFLCVIDPGVGSRRRGLAVEADGYRFVGPDNGLLSQVYGRAVQRRAVELGSAAHRLATVSRTFEGRDRFAPAAAWLARGTALEALGPDIDDPVSLGWHEPQFTDDSIHGEVIAIDRFGNLITNIERALVERLAPPRDVRLAGGAILPFVDTYADAPEGRASALIGSHGRLEVAIRNANAAAHLGIGVGALVQVRSGA